MMTIEFEGETFHFDMEEVTTDQLVKIQRSYPDLTILGLANGMREGDIRVLLCIYWLMQVQAGKDLLRLETVKIDKPVKFASAIQWGLIREQQAVVEAAEKALREIEGEKSAPKE